MWKSEHVVEEGRCCCEDDAMDMEFCWRVSRDKDEVCIVRIELTRDGGSFWSALFNGHDDEVNGSQKWEVVVWQRGRGI